MKLWSRDIPTPIRLLAIVSLVSSMGGSLMGPLVTLYVHDDLGRSVAAAGVVLLLQGLAGIAGQVAGGLLHDRYGGNAPLTLALAAAAATCALLALTHTWALYVSLMVAFGFARSVGQAPINALTAAFWRSGGRRAFNVLYVVRNIGFAAGAAMGGFAAQWSYALAFAVAAAVFVVAAAVTATSLPRPAEDLPIGRPLPAAAPPLPGARRRALAPLVALAVGTVLGSAVYGQWSTTVAVYMHGVGIPLTAYGLLWTLNGVGALALQPVANYTVRRLGPRLHRHLVLSAAMYVGSFGCLLATHQLWGFVAGIVFLTAGEIFDRPAWPAAMAALAEPGREGAYQGLIGSLQTTGRMLGPLAGGAAYDAFPPSAVWGGAAITAMLAAAAYAGYGAAHGPRRGHASGRAASPGSA